MKNSVSNPHKLVDRIIVSAVAIFVVVVALLVISLMRQSQLRQAVSTSSEELRENVDELQSTTEELRETVDQLRSDVPANDALPEELEAIDQQLTDLDEQLETMEQALEEIAPVLEDQQPAPASTTLPDPETVEAIQGEIHWLFTTAAWLIGATSVVTAILAFVVLNPLRTRHKRRAIIYPPEPLPLAQNDPDS